MSDDLVKRYQLDYHHTRTYAEMAEDCDGDWVKYSDYKAASDRIEQLAATNEELEAENEKLRKALEIYERERNRFKHATPEMSGAYFLAGGHGAKDDNMMPQFVEVVPAYGCGWSMIYEDTGRTISYEGS
jgi:hypothetical protein